jgi:hypothetical protein
MLRRITRSLAALGFTAAIFTASAPLALADGTSVSTEGPDSGVSVHSSNTTTVSNNNYVNVTNSNYQTATTGDATVSNNTTGGNATSGNASNSNTTMTSVSISNISSLPSGGGGSVSTEGPNSPVWISEHNTTTINNHNNVSVTNTNHQVATTGNAKVSNNTEGGNATSGNASNSNSTCTSISISNGGHASGNNNACEANQPGGGEGGGQGSNQGGQGGAEVLGATFTVASISGGRGAGAAQLPNTGLRDGLNPWIAVTILVLLGSVAYCRAAITPKLKSLK